ncbi:hypothetical protein GKA01_02970 [Gluconobacter kanchanaburiensis NBRC 103587]|uniref:Uncharacterized protein n=1 Tax=Gluconobacter kanchanaburiensis NBRC 103587 TaxID=1307948 RepID=A0A511B3T2_9PROT|nr:hypothetical protein AA103587_1456 [Gluconobacter kanchanaburiensis NBRC 103587]GEK95100.1 hypothetical protein GKA01_02970 [Gluconobacter kanchanaburiensis NBRC 103587]
MIGRMRMNDGQYHGSQIPTLEPQREFTADLTTRLTTAEPCHNFYTAPVPRSSPLHEVMQPLERFLNDISMQIQSRIHFHLSAGQPLPARIVQPRCPNSYGQF